MTAQFKEMEQGDAGWERTERPLYVPRLSLGKVCSPPPPWLQAGRQVDLQVLHSAAQASESEQYAMYFNDS